MSKLVWRIGVAALAFASAGAAAETGGSAKQANAVPAASGTGDSADPVETPADRERRDRTYCAPYPLPNDSFDIDLDVVNATIAECRAERARDLRRGDDNTRWLSRGSALGALGAVVSGFTGAAAGTTNAWFAIGVAPILADDVGQRQQVSEYRREFVARLDQLQCRATYLHDEAPAISLDRDELETRSLALERVLAEAIVEYERAQARPGAVPDAGYGRLVETSLTLLEQVAILSSQVGVYVNEDEIGRLQAISYNYLTEEYRRARSSALARPERTFRSIVASPLRAAADVVGGERATASQTFNYSSATRLEPAAYAAEYRIETGFDKTTVEGLNLDFRSPHFLRVSQPYRERARQIGELAERLSIHARGLQDDLVVYVEAATSANPAACPTYRVTLPGAAANAPAAAGSGNAGTPPAAAPTVPPPPPAAESAGARRTNAQ